MRIVRLFLAAAGVGALLLTVAGIARAGGARESGIEKATRRYYWSLLRADQKREVEKALGDFLATTAPDRDLAAARVLQWRAEAAAVLTVEQRKEAGKVAWFLRHLSEAERREGLDRLLDGTDREALARRLERVDPLGGASPEERVGIFVEVLDQAYDLVEPRLVERLALTEDQRQRLRAAYGRAKDDLKPTAVRIESAKAGLVRAGLALLDPEQRSKFDAFRAEIRAKVLGFVRKTEVTPPR